MSDKPISDLRRRMIADMTIRTFSDKTQRDYIRHIEAFASFLGRSPDTATGDDIRRFQFAQVEQGAQPPKMNGQASALRFFFIITLGRADLAHQLALRQLRFYMNRRTLEDAIREAALSRLPGGKRHPHRIPLHVLQVAERRSQAIAGQFQAAISFAELHRLIERHIKPIRGIGDLAIYDIAIRLARICGARRSIFTRARAKVRAP